VTVVEPVAAVLVRLNVAAPATPTTVADTVYDPAVAPAANVGAVATPSTPDVALADTLPPLKVPVAPLAGAVNVTLNTEVANSAVASNDDVLKVHDALSRLAQIDERLAKIVEMRYFAGLTEEETAEASPTSA